MCDLKTSEYILHTLKPRYFFGLKIVWLTGVSVRFRTIGLLEL